MNVPNVLTLLRILLIPCFIGFLLYDHKGTALAVFLLAALTDALDGAIARLFNQKTLIGTYLDPIADKLLLTAGFISLTALEMIPIWLTILVVSRDVILSVGTLILHVTQTQFSIRPTFLGKITTTVQLAYILLLLFFMVYGKNVAALSPLMIGTAVLTFGSGVHYLHRGLRLMGTGEPWT